MAISFNESLKAAQTTNTSTESEVTIATMSLSDESAMTSENQINSEFVPSDKYEWYNNYYDENFSQVDSLKNIKLNEKQINITQEENSQVIPFEIMATAIPLALDGGLR